MIASMSKGKAFQQVEEQPELFFDEPHEACGVFGIFAPDHLVAHLTYLGLYALQHRGQESAGMAVSDGESITVVKDMGLVSNVFDEKNLAALNGNLAIGQTRYSTTGSSTWRNAQPVYRGIGNIEFALGHNGNLVNTEQLASDAGMLKGTVASDSDLIAELISLDISAKQVKDLDDPMKEALQIVLPKLSGAFSLVFCDRDRIIGVRDPNGFRPLCLGRFDGGWVLASETAALDVIGAHFFLDCFSDDEILVILGRIFGWCKEDTKLVISDFSIPKTNGLRKFIAKLVVWKMIVFFRIFSGISACELPKIGQLLSEMDYRCLKKETLRNGFICSWVWQL